MAFSDPLANSMAGGPTLGLFKNPDGTYVAGSGVVPPPDSPALAAVVASPATFAAITGDLVDVEAATGTGTDPATINQLNAAIDEINTAIATLTGWQDQINTIVTALTAQNTSLDSGLATLEALRVWLVVSGSVKPPA